MTSTLIGIFISILTKLLASEVVEVIVIEAAKALAKKTDNEHDDKIVDKIAEVLGRK